MTSFVVNTGTKHRQFTAMDGSLHLLADSSALEEEIQHAKEACRRAEDINPCSDESTKRREEWLCAYKKLDVKRNAQKKKVEEDILCNHMKELLNLTQMELDANVASLKVVRYLRQRTKSAVYNE